ncbi:hypothetical protein LJB83_01160 [Clostridia bacterium OttesenSCG-928-F22]|nr:hypothetical protein [Clostridia bacterium OttesenSCG-928-F22]
MLGQFGFSYVGLIYLLMLFIPNIIWGMHKPEGYDAGHESRPLLLLERIGQVCCTCSALLFSNYNFASFSPWSAWLIVSFALMLLYEACWIRYFKSARTLSAFYRSFGFIPVPLASLPCAAFLLLGIYGKVIWLIISALMLSVGHIGIHLEHVRQLQK